MKSMNRFMILALGLSISASLSAATFVVNSALNTAGSTCSSSCTLRQALTAANATAATDSINFGFLVPRSGEILIQPSTPLPTITQPVTINGYSQTGTRVNDDPVASNALLRIRVDGVLLGAAGRGIAACASNVTIKGLSVTRFASVGIVFGTDNSGTLCATAPSNGFYLGILWV